ncbi:MAG: cytochrome c [Deltaproteobacteria bacterium]|nr:cytochrome c [Deltaproteobacteria bacterium]
MRLCIVFVIASVFCLFAVPAMTAAADGKGVFIQKCGSCHKAGGEAVVFAPTKYASTQWERFFGRNKHKRKKDISADFNQAELDAVKAYLVDHAADSDQPEAVGLR